MVLRILYPNKEIIALRFRLNLCHDSRVKNFQY